MFTVSSYAPRKGGQSSGLFRGFMLSTPQGYLTAGKQAALLAYVRTNASPKTGHEMRLVLEGRKPTDHIAPAALAEIRRLSAEFLTRT